MSSASFETITSELLVGFLENCQLFALTLLMAIPLGLIITFGSMSNLSHYLGLRKYLSGSLGVHL